MLGVLTFRYRENSRMAPVPHFITLKISECGAWLSLARALALGARGLAFKSHRPDLFERITYEYESASKLYARK